MRVELLRGAEADLLETYVRFEQANAGSGDRFYHTLDLALENVRQHPQIAPLYRGACRRLVLRQFGLGVFYAIAGERVIRLRARLRRDTWWAQYSIFAKIRP